MYSLFHNHNNPALAINDGCTPKWGTFKSMYPIGVQLGYNWGKNRADWKLGFIYKL